jgi:hypothetical protein
MASPLAKYRKWTDADLKRLVEMRVQESRSHGEMAVYFGRSLMSVRLAWHKCTTTLPEEVLQGVWDHRHWKEVEIKRPN